MNKRLIKAIQHCIIHSQDEYKMGAYSLKHLFESILGEYIPLCEFEDAMIKAGFKPEQEVYHIEVLQLPEVPSIYWGKGYQFVENG